MVNSERSFPEPLASVNKLEYDYADGNGIDFEPYSEFVSEEETNSWFRAWTGNEVADGSCFWIFGQDGSGGYAAFWITDSSKQILEQPIVFLGSEGETGVVASNFDGYLWILASGIGCYEAVAYPETEETPNAQFVDFALKNSGVKTMTRRAIIQEARLAYPDFPSLIDSQCR